MNMRNIMTLAEGVRLFEDHLTQQIEDACVERVIDDLNSDYASQYYVDFDYEQEHGEEPDKNSAEYQEFAKDWARNRVGDAYYTFAHLARGNQIRAWRVIAAPRNWTPHGQHIGIFWSWEKDAADAHWGDFENDNVKWRIEALLPVSGVDWIATISMNASPSYEEEKEIRIAKDTPVEIVSYEVIK